MTYFHVPADSLTPTADGTLDAFDGFRRAWTLSDGTAVAQATGCTVGTVLRDDDDLADVERPAPAVIREVQGLDRIIAGLTVAIRTARRLYQREDGTLPAAAQTFVDDLVAQRSRVKTRRDSRADGLQWPSDSVRQVLLSQGEDYDGLLR